jgi:REP-associated tyrosine transposase
MSRVEIWIHCVWSCKRRFPYLEGKKRHLLIDHIRENAKEKHIFIDTINACDDHVHCLLRLSAIQCIATVVQLLKGESAKWANEDDFFEGQLVWSKGYYAASIDRDTIGMVRRYIRNQQVHHQAFPFVTAYLEAILKEKE